MIVQGTWQHLQDVVASLQGRPFVLYTRLATGRVDRLWIRSSGESYVWDLSTSVTRPVLLSAFPYALEVEKIIP